jgi:hypothetical protein
MADNSPEQPTTQQDSQNTLQQKIKSLESKVSAFESYFNTFRIVGGDGVEVSGNLKLGYVINSR